MNVVGLENTAEVGLVRCTSAQPLDRRLFVAEGFKESIRKVFSLERLIRQFGDRFFYFDRVQLSTSMVVLLRENDTLRKAAYQFHLRNSTL